MKKGNTNRLERFNFFKKFIFLYVSAWCYRIFVRKDRQVLFPCCCRSVAQSCLTVCDPMNCSMPGFSVLHHLQEFAQTPVHWVSDATQPSHPLSSPSPSCLQSFPTSGSFPMSQFAKSGGHSIGASASVLPVNIRGWFSLGLTGWIFLLSKVLPRVFSSNKIQSVTNR